MYNEDIKRLNASLGLMACPINVGATFAIVEDCGKIYLTLTLTDHHVDYGRGRIYDLITINDALRDHIGYCIEKVNVLHSNDRITNVAYIPLTADRSICKVVEIVREEWNKSPNLQTDTYAFGFDRSLYLQSRARDIFRSVCQYLDVGLDVNVNDAKIYTGEEHLRLKFVNNVSGMTIHSDIPTKHDTSNELLYAIKLYNNSIYVNGEIAKDDFLNKLEEFLSREILRPVHRTSHGLTLLGF